MSKLLTYFVGLIVFLFAWSPNIAVISDQKSDIVISTSEKEDSEQDVYCLDPGNILNGHRQPEFRHILPLPVDSQLHFVCLPGYKLNGSRKMICQNDGTWKPSKKPFCKPVVCPEPYIENGYVRASQLGHSYQSGTTVQIVCNDGYRLKDEFHDMIECRLGGNWMAHAGSFTLELPVCIEQTCPSPPERPNSETQFVGNIGMDGRYKQNSVVTYHCNSGFQIEDLRGSRLVCLNGKWHPEFSDVSLSYCVHGGCSRPLLIANGYYVPSFSYMYPYGTQITYHCHKDFTLIGQAWVYQCMHDGHWSPPMQIESLPVCHHHLAIGCSEPPNIGHGHIEKMNGTGLSITNNFPENTVVTYACDPGYHLYNCIMNWIICKEGSWINPTPICVELNSCGPPPAVSYAIVSHQDLSIPITDDYAYPFYTKVHYKCLPGFQLLGTPDLICNLDGCWTPNLPQCILTSASYESEWSIHPSYPSPETGTKNDYNWSDSHLITVSVATAGSIIGALLLIQIIVLFQRKKCCIHRQHLHLHSHQRNSSSVSLPSSPCHLSSANDPDRVALIAFADGVQVVLPTYEEAIRQTGPPPFETFTGVHRGRWSRNIFPSLPPTRRFRMSASMRDNSTETTSGPTRQSSSASQSASVADSIGSTDTVANSEASTTVTLDTLSSNTSQPMSCHAVCGSLASFDTTSMMNTEGVPLLEENEAETSDETTITTAITTSENLLSGVDSNIVTSEPESSIATYDTSD